MHAALHPYMLGHSVWHTHTAYIADLDFKLLTHTPASSCHRCAATAATAAAALLVCYRLQAATSIAMHPLSSMNFA